MSWNIHKNVVGLKPVNIILTLTCS